MTQDFIVQVEFPQAGVGASRSNKQGIFWRRDSCSRAIVDSSFWFSKTAMYPPSAIFGTLINVECKFGTMFILLASGRRLCLNCILRVALIVVLSGSMKIFSNGEPVSMNKSMSFSAPAPDEHPVSRILVLLLIFCFRFSLILFLGYVAGTSIAICSTFFWLLSGSSCSSTRQASGDQ